MNKTEKIKIGDLVCMPRRRKPGMGIVLKYSDDLAREGGINVMKILEETRELISYTDRAQIFKNAYRRCGDAEFLDQAFYYNAGWANKPKLKFAYVKWTNKPSDYTMKEVFASEAWYPVEWLKSY
tara:strand:+ start:113 stop:487 length:375 start_codon:yes stop_codon:yes gene_type:complete